MHLKISSTKYQPFCSGRNVLKYMIFFLLVSQKYQISCYLSIYYRSKTVFWWSFVHQGLPVPNYQKIFFQRWKKVFWYLLLFLFSIMGLPLPNPMMISSISVLEKNGWHSAEDSYKCILLNDIFSFWMKFHWSSFLRVQVIKLPFV